ncbi:MAG TPA: tetratricopeptide repeat protein [Bryobacteraceae bacterium]|nr:tetratricopeptide repeat protein [Bryobacteraceae bacterium]
MSQYGSRPAAERGAYGPRKISAFQKFWNAVKPPPPVHSPVKESSPGVRRRRKRILTWTASTLVLASGAFGAYLYVSTAPERAQAILDQGMRAMATVQYPQAVALFTKATGAWAQLANGYLERGLAHQQLNQTDAALADFERAIQVNPNLAAAHTALGTIYRQRGNLQRAIGEFSSSIELEQNVDAYYQRGQTYQSQGQFQKALDDYNSAIEQIPSAPYVYQSRASVRDSLGDHDGAEQDRQRAAALEHHVF